MWSNYEENIASHNYGQNLDEKPPRAQLMIRYDAFDSFGQGMFWLKKGKIEAWNEIGGRSLPHLLGSKVCQVEQNLGQLFAILRESDGIIVAGLFQLIHYFVKAEVGDGVEKG